MKYLISLSIVLSSIFAFGQNLQPTDDIAVITVIVKNASGVASIGDKVSFKSKKSGKLYTGISSTGGTFQIKLPEGDTYVVLVKGFEMTETPYVFEVPSNPGPTTGTYTITYELPKMFTLKDLYFDTGKATIRPNSYSTLNDLAELMRRKKTMVVLIEGHTDSDGDELANKKLSEARALAVKKYLTSKGIQSIRVQTIGHGESQPKASNSTAAGKQQNRRTEVKVIHQ